MPRPSLTQRLLRRGRFCWIAPILALSVQFALAQCAVGQSLGPLMAEYAADEDKRDLRQIDEHLDLDDAERALEVGRRLLVRSGRRLTQQGEVAVPIERQLLRRFEAAGLAARLAREPYSGELEEWELARRRGDREALEHHAQQALLNPFGLPALHALAQLDFANKSFAAAAAH